MPRWSASRRQGPGGGDQRVRRVSAGAEARRQRHSLAQGELGLLAPSASAAGSACLGGLACRRVSIRAKRPGCSDWAERTRPQIAAAAGSGDSPSPAPSRPSVSSARRESALGCSASQSLDRLQGRLGRPRGRPRRPLALDLAAQRLDLGGRRLLARAAATSVHSRPEQARRGPLRAPAAGRGSSGPQGERVDRAPAGRRSPSAMLRARSPRPRRGQIRTRSSLAPPARRPTPLQEKGSSSSARASAAGEGDRRAGRRRAAPGGCAKRSASSAPLLGQGDLGVDLARPPSRRRSGPGRRGRTRGRASARTS